MRPHSGFLASFLLVLAPVSSFAAEPGPPVPVSAPVAGRAYGTQRAPRVAFNGLTGYAVWVTVNDLYGSPVDASGAPLRVPPTWLGTAGTADVASSGTGFLLAYSYEGRTFLRAVAADGIPGAAREIPVTTCGKVTLEANGESHLLTSGDAGTDCPSEIIAIDAQGQTNVTQLAPGSFESRMTATAAFGGFVVARGAAILVPEYHFTLDVRLVSTDGSTAVQANVPTDGTPIHSLASAANANETLVVWGSEYGLRAQRLDRALQPIGTTIVLRYEDASVEGVVAIGDEFWVLTRGFEGDLGLARVHEGAVAGESIEISGSAGGGDLAIAGSRLLAVWAEGSVTSSSSDWGDIAGASIDSATAAVGPRHLVSTSAHAQIHPVVTFAGAAYAVAWQETTDDSDLILVQRFTDAAEALDVPPVEVSERLHHATAPAIAFNGSTYLVVWQEGYYPSTTILGRHLLPNLEPVEAQPFTIATNGYGLASPRVASDGRGFLVVWTANAAFPTHTRQSDVLARRVSGDSPQMDDATVVSLPSESSQLAPDVVWDGRHYVAVWGTSFWYGGHSATLTSILAAALDERGVVTERATVVPEVSTGYNGAGPPGESVYTPRIAWSGDVRLVVWQSSGSIMGRLLEEPGVTPTTHRRRGVRRPPWFRITDRDAGMPSIAWDGSSFIVMWPENRYEELVSSEAVRGARVPEFPGTEPVMEPFEIAGAARPTGSTASVAAGNGTAMFAFARYEVEEPYSGAPRVYLRAVR